MKILVCGDLHTKFDILKEVQERANKFDKVVILGDYVDDWDRPPAASENLLNAVIEWKLAEPEKVILLLGNHDLSEWKAGKFLCSGFNRETYYLVKKIMDKYGSLFSVAWSYKDYLFTHAGITKKWAESMGMKFETAAGWCDALNSLASEEFNGLEMTGAVRGGYQAPSPLWADRVELIEDPIDGVVQVVGHSPIESIEDMEVYSGGEKHLLYFCDTHSLYPDGTRIGDNKLLELEVK